MKLSDDPQDMGPLTPNHLLLSTHNPLQTRCLSSKMATSAVPSRHVLAPLICIFFLPSLQLRQKWAKQKRNFTLDIIVLILDEKTPRQFWPLG